MTLFLNTDGNRGAGKLSFMLGEVCCSISNPKEFDFGAKEGSIVSHQAYPIYGKIEEFPFPNKDICIVQWNRKKKGEILKTCEFVHNLELIER